jgi:hypothetical protein
VVGTSAIIQRDGGPQRRLVNASEYVVNVIGGGIAGGAVASRPRSTLTSTPM